MTSDASDTARPPAYFATTRWSIVVSAGHQSSPDAERALETLCRTYWYPLYAFARRRGCTPDDAADSTQEFFGRLLEREYLVSADPERGRFRSFLLTMFKRFLLKQHERDQAQKRGGGRSFLSIDAQAGEERYRYEPSDAWTPEALFERRWAVTLLQQVVDNLQSEYAAKGKAELFELCKPWLTGAHGRPQAEIAAELEMNETALRVAIHRMRDRYRELLRQEVGQTIAETDDIDDELRRLRSALRGPVR